MRVEWIQLFWFLAINDHVHGFITPLSTNLINSDKKFSDPSCQHYPFQSSPMESISTSTFGQASTSALFATADSEPNENKKRKKRKPKTKKKKKKSFPVENPTAIETWRIFGITTHPDEDPYRPISHANDLSSALQTSLFQKLKVKDESKLQSVQIVRRSLDARKRLKFPQFNYVLDIELTRQAAHDLKFKNIPGKMELTTAWNQSEEEEMKETNNGLSNDDDGTSATEGKKKVIVVGAGPAGLFCALVLARSGLVTPILLERGQPVERRGRDIGALIHRRSMDPESNFAFGEGGAGTWSDGKLTTRIGRNSDAVRFVLETFVEYGAPSKILLDGAPHLGTDNLVRLLRNMRQELIEMGGEIRFGTAMTRLELNDQNQVEGVYIKQNEQQQKPQQQVADSGSDNSSNSSKEEYISGDAVVLATGHSARDIYETLHEQGVTLEPKGFAVGFRVEHPQKLINKIQYGTEWGNSVTTGKSKTDKENDEFFHGERDHTGSLPVPSYRLATDKANDGTNQTRGVYSFCMCPGGQIVPASTDPDQVCVNGMSFSKRDSLWANSALVVTVNPNDEVLAEYREKFGVLAGLEFQKDMERKASVLGGGNLTVPVQRVTDFCAGIVSETVPSSSYRLGVKAAPCHEIYPAPITDALRDALTNHFDGQMPGYYSKEGLLHAVETRTSSPMRISRNSQTLSAIGSENLFPAGEGAGFAGGIVSAAVDGMAVAEAVLDSLYSETRQTGKSKDNKKSKSVGFNY